LNCDATWLSNKAINEIVRIRPSTKEQLVALPGVGQKRVDEFGEASGAKRTRKLEFM
jgi:hypothetical protein